MQGSQFAHDTHRFKSASFTQVKIKCPGNKEEVPRNLEHHELSVSKRKITPAILVASDIKQTDFMLSSDHYLLKHNSYCMYLLLLTN